MGEKTEPTYFKRAALFVPDLLSLEDGVRPLEAFRKDALFDRIGQRPQVRFRLSDVLSGLSADRDFFIENPDGLENMPPPIAQQVRQILSDVVPNIKRSDLNSWVWLDGLYRSEAEAGLRLNESVTGILYWGDYKNPDAQLLIPYFSIDQNRVQIRSPFVVANSDWVNRTCRS